MVQATGNDASWSSYGGVSGTSCWEKTEVQVERCGDISALGLLGIPQFRLAHVAMERKVWGPLLKPLHP